MTDFATALSAAGVEDVDVTGPRVVLDSRFDVTGLAVASVAAATRAAADLLAVRRGESRRAVAVDSRAACAAFACETLFEPIGWQRPPLWDPIAGNYRTADGWVRLHTNYPHHRAAAEAVLGASDRASVAAEVAGRSAVDVEQAVVLAGGCAAALHSRAEWLASEPGAAAAGAPPVEVIPGEVFTGGTGWIAEPTGGPAPLAGIRVLDLTRVIAGPVATRVLAAYGADVLRVDPPGFAEVSLLLAETTAGKHTTALDLREPAGRAAFEGLVSSADVLVGGLRGDALGQLGYGPEALRALNPGMVVARLDAYGWHGPWRHRRGFDSLVQMSCGIAAAGGGDPDPLPVQALDHGTGWLLAAAVVQALTRRLSEGRVDQLRAALVGTAELLWRLPAAAPDAGGVATGLQDAVLEPVATAWGPARRVPLPGTIEGVRPRWSVDAGPLGRHGPQWQPR